MTTPRRDLTFIHCACHSRGHYLCVEYEWAHETNDLRRTVSLSDEYRPTFRERMKMIWKLLRGNNASYVEVILTQKNLDKLKDALNGRAQS